MLDEAATHGMYRTLNPVNNGQKTNLNWSVVRDAERLGSPHPSRPKNVIPRHWWSPDFSHQQDYFIFVGKRSARPIFCPWSESSNHYCAKAPISDDLNLRSVMPILLVNSQEGQHQFKFTDTKHSQCWLLRNYLLEIFLPYRWPHWFQSILQLLCVFRAVRATEYHLI